VGASACTSRTGHSPLATCYRRKPIEPGNGRWPHPIPPAAPLAARRSAPFWSRAAALRLLRVTALARSRAAITPPRYLPWSWPCYKPPPSAPPPPHPHSPTPAPCIAAPGRLCANKRRLVKPSRTGHALVATCYMPPAARPFLQAALRLVKEFTIKLIHNDQERREEPLVEWQACNQWLVFYRFSFHC
jgi:hypothetical protein